MTYILSMRLSTSVSVAWCSCFALFCSLAVSLSLHLQISGSRLGGWVDTMHVATACWFLS